MIKRYLTPEDYAIAEKNGISARNAYQRVYVYDMPVDEAITKPVEKKISPWQTFKEIAEKHGVCRKTFHSRLDSGLEPLEAATKPISNVGRKKKQIS